MAFAVELSRRAKKDHREYIKASSPLNKKIAVLLSIISIDPRDKISRIGKPEQLKHYEKKEVWSRRISKHHRMVYEIIGNKVRVVSLLGHYGDK
ncbi:MAG: hypothetical protein Pg6B_10640 [Candidatus Azobacteroides pseudotrichonymphae]|nr:MAG: hypothetical protein Pg6B_10640 [Candidatus Azobacteroides pseudotrichonymphae]